MDLQGLIDYFQTENPEIDGRKNQKRKHSEKPKSEVIDEGQERPIKKSRSNENENCSNEDSDSDVVVLGHFRSKSRHSPSPDDHLQSTVKLKTVSKQTHEKVDNIGNKVVNHPQKKNVDFSDDQSPNDDRTCNNKEKKTRKR
jgi:hypothetical protein